MPARMAFESKGLEDVESMRRLFGVQRLSFRVRPVTAAARTRNLWFTRRASARPGFARLARPREWRPISALVGSFVRGDLFDQLDNAAPKPGVGDAGECAGQRQSLRCRQEIGHVCRRGPFAEPCGAGGAAGASLKQERYRHLKYFGDLLNAACTDAVGP